MRWASIGALSDCGIPTPRSTSGGPVGARQPLPEPPATGTSVSSHAVNPRLPRRAKTPVCEAGAFPNGRFRPFRSRRVPERAFSPIFEADAFPNGRLRPIRKSPCSTTAFGGEPVSQCLVAPALVSGAVDSGLGASLQRQREQHGIRGATAQRGDATQGLPLRRQGSCSPRSR